VTGDLDVDGDLTEGLRRCWMAARVQDRGRLTPRRWGTVLRLALAHGVIGGHAPDDLVDDYG